MIQMYQWRKKIAIWVINKILHISVVFYWDIREAINIAKAYKGKVIVGGPAAMLNREMFDDIAEVKESIDGIEPILFHNPLASFSTRGCPNRCSFCAVHRIEPEFTELKEFRPAPVMCDNNFLASSRKHQERVINKLRCFRKIDFNQGLDARYFTHDAADRLGKLNIKVRFGFDSVDMESKVADAVKLCRKRTTKDIGIYVLIGYKDTPEDALYRLETVRSWGIRPNPMRYQPLNCINKNEYVAVGWTERELRKIMQYYSRLCYYEHIPYEEFNRQREKRQLMLELA